MIKTELRLGKIIAHTRSQYGWSQATLAERALISEATVSRIEGGGQSLRVETLIAIAGAFGILASELLRQAEIQGGAAAKERE